jgi:hypothetical protein
MLAHSRTRSACFNNEIEKPHRSGAGSIRGVARKGNAVLGNAGSIISFRVGVEDAPYLVREFHERFAEVDFLQLPNYRVYLKLMIDGTPSAPGLVENPERRMLSYEILRCSLCNARRLGDLAVGQPPARLDIKQHAPDLHIAQAYAVAASRHLLPHWRCR